ncbi:MAG: sigma 54-interacting transcriptional regulator [Oscillospiraceae bacterium]|nr:sigma 54-interacting transcriptional regulator [Oscillospiraceae bacterium]
MSVLDLIVPELEFLANTLASVMDLEITIVDSSMTRLVGTGRMSSGVGKLAPKGSAFSQCIETGRHLFVEEPRVSSICKNCSHRELCTEEVEFCIPIRYNSRIVGVLGMCAFTEAAKAEILRNKDNLLAFEHQLSRLITTMLREREFESIMEYHSSELMTLVNSLDEGVLILSKNLEILTANKHMFRILNMNERPLNGASHMRLQDVLPEKVFGQLQQKGMAGQVGPVVLNEQEYLISISPVEVKSGRTGLILLFSDFSKMRQSVMRADKEKSIVTFDDILGECESIQKARRQAQQIAGYDVSVLLTGETGTGKEIFSQAIHGASARQGDIFLPVNCGAIPENLIESEMFGYEKGAFTGASKTGRTGKFEVCKDGTLFLDEIGDLPLAMQVKLLRALENKEIVRVGGHTPIRVNPRIIAATSRNLDTMMREHAFREDLFYRLNVVSIQIPPLRERGYDIIILARHFLHRFAATYNKDLKGFTGECENLLLRYPFPGNIRELRNLVEYAVIFEKNNLVGEEIIRSKLQPSAEAPRQSLAQMTRQYERQVILQQVREMGDTAEGKRQVAKQLGISVATLYRKLGEED